MIIKKRKRKKMGIREPAKMKCQPHRAYVRTHECLVGSDCEGWIEAAHVRLGLPAGEQAGMGQKPSDIWCFPLCAWHHSEQHTMGEKSFEKKYQINMKEAAEQLARFSPHRAKWEDAA